MTKTLAEILSDLPTNTIIAAQGDLDVAVKAPIVESVGTLEEGGVFLARQGAQFDGHDFTEEAIRRGAVAIIGEKPLQGMSTPYVQLDAVQQNIGLLSAAYHNWPARKLTLIGVTGTDGKTTTTHLIHSILQEIFPNRVGLVSTLRAFCGDQEETTGLHVTSPPAPRLQSYLARMLANGLTHAVIEMTSHGLSQGRLQGVELAVAVLTNIQHEHLDFHGSWEEYRQAKGRMFTYMRGGNALRVINADEEASQHYLTGEFKTFGYDANADYRIEEVSETGDGMQIRLRSPQGQLKLHTSLIGAYNAANCAAAVAAASPYIEGDERVVERGIRSLSYLPGRMEPIDVGQNFQAYVDFAHTPAALQVALVATRKKMTDDQRLCVVFGSAGLRDIQKRKLMSEIATKLADYVVLTAEDPRTESLEAILTMMADACQKQGGRVGIDFTCIPDRSAALLHACQWAEQGDIVLACGKGHEQSMCFGTTEYPWDDRDALRAALHGKLIVSLPTAQSS